MDASQSPEPSTGAGTAQKGAESQTAQPSERAVAPPGGASVEEAGEPGSDAAGQRNTTWTSLIRMAAGGFLSNGDETSETEDEGLGPAFDTLGAAERAMVANILRLHDLRVADVMTPRADIIAVSEDAGLQDVMQALHRGSLSRLPVFHETLDDPLGFVHLKDLALAFGVGCQKTERPFRLRDHLRTALYVPPSMRIAALMQKMQAERVHMALVIDEFGGVDGLVTIEDLVEQIVGDIEDEHDTAETKLWRAETPGVYLIDARADIEEFADAEHVRLVPEDWEEDADTLGGLVFMLTGRVPTRGEVISHPEGHEFEVVDADPRRIRRLRLTLNGAQRPSSLPLRRQAAE